MKTLISSILAASALYLATPAQAMECLPTELPVRLTVGIVDVNGNVFVKGTPGCAQSAVGDGRVRVVLMRMNATIGAASTTVIEVQPTPAEVEAR